ncbi:uncharacterized protein RSE6_05852 [Rhynchosporium secalis]|uniref:Uncharacterized protein n=1 Tax=Rhynchosporium secalis TaxID=38038 RepID=A0A1E1MA24_RHYSE|nr:uncharacterized protein RSE6_05852 [Rhynchosporium secalis]
MQAHSAVLKLHSKYSRRVLDTKHTGQASPLFHYEFIAAYNSNGRVWSLQAISKPLCPMRSYLDHLVMFTNPSKFSPILSATLTATLSESPIFNGGVDFDQKLINYLEPLIWAAKKLHYAELFLLMVSLWRSDRFLELRK